MRKIIAVLLVVLQLAFPAAFAGYNASTEKALLRKGTEYTFKVDALELDRYDDDITMLFRIKQPSNFYPAEPSVDENSYYWIKTGADGYSLVLRKDCKPANGDYITGFNIIWPVVNYTYGVTDILSGIGNGLKNALSEQYVCLYAEKTKEGTFLFPDAEREQFTVFLKAKVYKGRMQMTDVLINGQSTKEYMISE